MRKSLYASVILFVLGIGACSDDDDVQGGGDDEYGYDDGAVLADDAIPQTIPHQSYFIANEDWFGHEMGSCNRFYPEKDTIVYRCFRKANPGKTLGVTTQFAMNWGGYIYFMSKQAPRLVIADAETLEEKISFNVIDGDGRGCLGVDVKTVYVATTNGIRIFRVNKWAFGGFVKGTSSATGDLYEGQIGDMVRAGDYVFAALQGKGVLVIDPVAHEVKKVIEVEMPGALCVDKEGYLWTSAKEKELWRIDPYTCEIVKQLKVAKAPSVGWGAWRPSSLCASTQKNVIYWNIGTAGIAGSTGNQEYRYDIDKDEMGPINGVSGYGVSRVETLIDVIVNCGGGTYDGTTGEQVSSMKILGGLTNENASYAYFFPSIPFFEDTNEPHVLVNQNILKPGEEKKICLSDQVYDADNTSVSILKDLIFNEKQKLVTYRVERDTLYLKAGSVPGSTKFIFNVCSNGRENEKSVRVDVRE